MAHKWGFGTVYYGSCAKRLFLVCWRRWVIVNAQRMLSTHKVQGKSFPPRCLGHEKFKLYYPFWFRGMNFYSFLYPSQSVGLSKKIHLSK